MKTFLINYWTSDGKNICKINFEGLLNSYLYSMVINLMFPLTIIP